MIESVGGSMKDATGNPALESTGNPVGDPVAQSVAEPVEDDAAWWPLVWRKLTSCWLQLVAVLVVAEVVEWASQMLRGMLGVFEQYLLGAVLVLAVGHLTTAWQWSAVLRILDGRHDFASAVRPDFRQVGRLWGWLVLFDVVGLSQLLYFMGAGFSMLSSGWNTLVSVSLYLTYATALLPMAVLLDGQGPRRAWRLTHSRWGTVLRVLPVLVGRLLVQALLLQMMGPVLYGVTNPLEAVAMQVVSSLVTVAVGVPVAVLLYAAYRHAAGEIARRARIAAAMTDAQ